MNDINTMLENKTVIEDTQKDRYLTFTLGDETFGIEIMYVVEIVGIQPITKFPELPEYIKGVINLRGKIIPVMDVRLRFKREPIEYDERTCIIVIELKEISVGLIVDGVSEVLVIPEEDIAEPPQLGKGNCNIVKSIGKVGNDVKLLLDCNMLLNGEEIVLISETI